MNFKLQLSILFGGIALLFTSCAKPVEQPKPIDMDALKMEIQKMEDAFAAAEKAKDAAAVAAYYSDDAVSYGRNSEPTSGKAAIQAKEHVETIFIKTSKILPPFNMISKIEQIKLINNDVIGP